MWPSFAPDARPLDRGKPRDEDTEGGNQPADKSLINRRLSLRSQLCAAQAFLAADGLSVERAFNRAFPLDREHKRLDGCSLMGQGGSSSGVDAFGCLRSLRARSALDGVSWVQRGSVEIAVGQRLAPATQSTPSSAPSLGRRSAWELDSASCLVACRLRRTRTPSRLEASHA